MFCITRSLVYVEEKEVESFTSEFFLLGLFLLVSCSMSKTVSSHSSPDKSCRLNSGEVITIACPHDCQEYDKRALMESAQLLGYTLQFVGLNLDEKVKEHKIADGYLLEGGSDINPLFYEKKLPYPGMTKALWQTINPDLKHKKKERKRWKKRDQFEYQFVQDFLSKPEFQKVPLLGICRGMQMLTVVSGIPLYPDIKTNIGVNTFDSIVTPIKIKDKNSLFHQLFGEQELEVLELHHQGLHYQYYKEHQSEFSHIKVTASSMDDQIAEVIEFIDRPILGVQFHPERSSKEVRQKVFSWFLQESCNSKKSSL